MNIKLLKTFATIGFNLKLEKDGTHYAVDNNGNELQEGLDYIIEEKDKLWPISIEMASGGIVYLPPQ